MGKEKTTKEASLSRFIVRNPTSLNIKLGHLFNKKTILTLLNKDNPSEVFGSTILIDDPSHDRLKSDPLRLDLPRTLKINTASKRPLRVQFNHCSIQGFFDTTLTNINDDHLKITRPNSVTWIDHRSERRVEIHPRLRPSVFLKINGIRFGIRNISLSGLLAVGGAMLSDFGEESDIKNAELWFSNKKMPVKVLKVIRTNTLDGNSELGLSFLEDKSCYLDTFIQKIINQSDLLNNGKI